MLAVSLAVAVVVTTTLFLRWFWQRPVGTLEGKAIFITGCDTGFGRLMALRYAAEGAHVFASFLTKNGAEAVKKEATGIGELTSIQLDVRSNDQVFEAADNVRGELEKNGSKLYAVINNAGIIAGNFIELSEVEEYERTMDINFLGCVRVVKAFLPLLQQPGGYVIAITSCSELASAPAMSAYAASKHAQRAFMDALRFETYRSGIRVVKILPGMCNTPMVQNAIRANTGCRRYEEATADKQSRIGQSAIKKHAANVVRVSQIATDPISVVSVIRRTLLQKHPPPRVLVGYDAYCLYWPLSLLPDSLQNLICLFT